MDDINIFSFNKKLMIRYIYNTNNKNNFFGGKNALYEVTGVIGICIFYYVSLFFV